MDEGRTSLQPPVFVFPAKLDFYVKDPSTYTRTLSIYNPYSQEIRFKSE